MNIVLNNPYRQLGILVGATAREKERQIKRLKQFLAAEQEPDDDFSFNSLGRITRTIQSVEDAASQLNLDADKLNAAIFWFYNGNGITDEPAFEALKDSDINRAIEIWSKLSGSNEVTQRNASAFQNLSTLLLFKSMGKKVFDESSFTEAIKLKLKYLESDFVKEFKALATDETYRTTKKEIQLLFLNSVQSVIDSTGGISLEKFFEILSGQSFSAKEDFQGGYIKSLIETITKMVESAKSKRNKDKQKADAYAKELHSSTKKPLQQLLGLVGNKSDQKYSSVADKVANEILQCSIDFFNFHQEAESNNGYLETALTLTKAAEKIAVGSLSKERIKDSLNTLDEMKDKELNLAIAALSFIKQSFEEREKEIREEVHRLTMGSIFSGYSIDYDKVNQAIANALNWDAVIGVVQKSIPQKNIEIIKKSNNTSKLSEYKNLVEFLLSKLSGTNKRKVQYLSYWSSGNPVMSKPNSTLQPENATRTNTTATVQSSNNTQQSSINPNVYKKGSEEVKTGFQKNAVWIFGIAGFVLGIIILANTDSLAGIFWGTFIGIAFGRYINKLQF